MDTYNFYIDDSGTRHPDHNANKPQGHPDWFALGGVLIHENDENAARTLHANFTERWGIKTPLHSSDIRQRAREFGWLRNNGRQEEFMNELTELLTTLPVFGLACVIDRPGYNARYAATYGPNRWSLCKTAFTIAVERATKFVLANDARLRVLVERSSKDEERKLKEYYSELREKGLPFDSNTSAKHAPLAQADFARSLFDFKIKSKTSPIMQIADLYLYPICRAGYGVNRAYEELVTHRKLIEHAPTRHPCPTITTKYSCFDAATN